MADTTDGSSSTYSPHIKAYTLLIEYRHLPKYVPGGVFVRPASDDAWHGVIFIRQGVYKEGIFKFVIEFGADFPESAPVVRFLSSIFHPAIATDTGLVDLPRFADWRPREHHVWHVLADVKKLFYHIGPSGAGGETGGEDGGDANEADGGSGSSIASAFNPEAAALFVADPDDFAARAQVCVQESLMNVYEEPDVGGVGNAGTTGGGEAEADAGAEAEALAFAIPFKRWDEARHGPVRDRILNRDPTSPSGDTGGDGLLSWVSKGVGKSLGALVGL